MERYLRVNLLGPGPRIVKNNIYGAAVSQSLRNTGLNDAMSGRWGRDQKITEPHG